MVGSTPARAAGQGHPLPAAAVRRARRAAGRPASTSCTSPARTTSTPSRPRAVIDAGMARRLREATRRRHRRDAPTWSARADAAGVVHAVCFNLRYYAQNQNAAADGGRRRRSARRGSSPAHYLQDWLLLETDWNWRLDAERQGKLRAVADIGSHWIDLAGFVTGQRVEAVCADLHTFVPERDRPTGEVETFAAATVGADVERVRGGHGERRRRRAAAALRRRRRAACAPCRRCRPGRKNARVVGGRRRRSGAGVDVRATPTPVDRPPRAPERARSRRIRRYDRRPAPRRRRTRPATSRATRTRSAPCSPRSTPTSPPAAPAARPTYPTFADGHDVVAVCEAIAESARTGLGASRRRPRSTRGSPDEGSTR